MIRVETEALIARLSPECRSALEASAALCISRSGVEITPAHLLLQLLDNPFSDVRIMLERAEVDWQTLQTQLQQQIEHEPRHGDSGPVFSPLLIDVLQDAWLLASTELDHSRLRSGSVFLAILMQSNRYLLPISTGLLASINREQVRRHFSRLTAGSAEAEARKGSGAQTGSKAAAESSGGALDRYARDFTAMARSGEMDPVLCRDAEIDQMIDILSRRRKNNPIVVGEAGVGKSAVVEGLALRIAAGDVPETLRDVVLMSLDLGALQAGASVKGEFERRLRGVIDEVGQSPVPIILFIDEAHTLIGAGNQEGSGDAANLLKPALARGELRTIAATTWREYRKYFEKDPALSRRFQPVKLDEPDPEQAIHILRGLRKVYEQSHQVLIEDSALQAAARLSARYIAARQLPDKAIDVLDTACARVRLNLSTPPRQLSHLRSQLHQCDQQQALQQRSIALGEVVPQAEQTALETRMAGLHQQAGELEQRWETQRALVSELVALRKTLLRETDEGSNPAEQDTLRQRAGALRQELDQLSADEPLVSASVTDRQIAEVISDWTGVPLKRMTEDALDRITRLPDYLHDHIRGQAAAIASIHRSLLTARADLRRPGRPLGAFLLAGPSGVGKTETVIQIADLLFGGRSFLTTINMSEYQETHSLSRLIGSPPGYVGFGEGGVLTEAIRQKPYSVVLLDEVEKAHPDVLNLFYQAFDKGELADGEGRLVDCRNVVFFLTSNLGDQVITHLADDPAAIPAALYPELEQFFRPALLARMSVVPYLPLNRETLAEIVDCRLVNLSDQIQARYKAAVTVEPELAETILARATRSENGARMLESVIETELLPPVSLALLQRLSAGQAISEVVLGSRDGEFYGQVS